MSYPVAMRVDTQAEEAHDDASFAFRARQQQRRPEAAGRQDDPLSARRGVVLFYASWCGHCREAFNTLNVDALRAEHPGLFRIRDAHKDEECESFLQEHVHFAPALKKHIKENNDGKIITGYPTIVIIDDAGYGTFYNEERTYDAMKDVISWL